MIRKLLLPVGVLLALTGGCGRSGLGDAQDGAKAFREANYTRAVASYLRATQRMTDSPELYYNLGRAHVELGNLESAKEAFSAALELRPEDSDALTQLAQLAWQQNDPLQAQGLLARALQGAAQPEARARILNVLALTEWSRERYDLARLHLVHALRLHNTYAPAYYNLASLYRDKFNLREEALDNFEMFVRLVGKRDPYRDKAANNIKRLRLNLERTRAEEQERVRRDPAAAARHLQEGMRQQLGRQYPRAIKAYRDALAADPMTFAAAYGLALSHKAQGQRAEAAEAFRLAAEISPSHQESSCEAADLLLQLRRPAEAAQALDRAIARSPYNPATADLMARIRYAERRPAEARAYGEFFLALLSTEDPRRAEYEKWVLSLPVR